MTVRVALIGSHARSGDCEEGVPWKLATGPECHRCHLDSTNAPVCLCFSPLQPFTILVTVGSEPRVVPRQKSLARSRQWRANFEPRNSGSEEKSANRGLILQPHLLRRPQHHRCEASSCVSSGWLRSAVPGAQVTGSQPEHHPSADVRRQSTEPHRKSSGTAPPIWTGYNPTCENLRVSEATTVPA